jgi:hypothetical protein
MSTVCTICLDSCCAPRCSIDWNSFYKIYRDEYHTVMLSHVYNCGCKSMAHKSCLRGVLKCPTCREPISPSQFNANLDYNSQDTEMDCFIKDNYPSYYRNCIGPLKDRDENAIASLFNMIYYWRQIDWQFWLCCYFVVVFGLFIYISKQFSCAPKIELCLKKNANNACYSCSLHMVSQNTNTNSNGSDSEGIKFAITLSFVLSSISFIIGCSIITFAYFVNLVLIRASLAFFYVLIYASHLAIAG